MVTGFHPFSSFEAIGMDRSVVGLLEVAAMKLPAFVKFKRVPHGLFSEN